MLTLRVGRRTLQNTQTRKGILQYATMLAAFALTVFVILQNSSYSLNADSLTSFANGFGSVEGTPTKKAEPKLGPCGIPKTCPEGHFSFQIRSGAASVVAPIICLENKFYNILACGHRGGGDLFAIHRLMGSLIKTAGEGLNIAVVNGKTGELIKTGYFNMYDGEIEPLITFLQSIEEGSAVLMASFDEPSTKLNDDARKLIGELGSSAIQSVGFRDNWVFVGGKGTEVRSNFEKHIKNNREMNKYDGWPEMIDLEGCIPHYLQ